MFIDVGLNIPTLSNNLVQCFIKRWCIGPHGKSRQILPKNAKWLKKNNDNSDFLVCRLGGTLMKKNKFSNCFSLLGRHHLEKKTSSYC